MSYNGWSNYETWVVKLWMDNDCGISGYFVEMANNFRSSYNLSNAIKEYYEENNPINEASVYSDLLSNALGQVDWYEIAEVILEDNDIEDEDSIEQRRNE